MPMDYREVPKKRKPIGWPFSIGERLEPVALDTRRGRDDTTPKAQQGVDGKRRGRLLLGRSLRAALP